MGFLPYLQETVIIGCKGGDKMRNYYPSHQIDWREIAQKRLKERDEARAISLVVERLKEKLEKCEKELANLKGEQKA